MEKLREFGEWIKKKDMSNFEVAAAPTWLGPAG